MERAVYTKYQAYNILGLRESATMDEVEQARKNLVKLLHPDNNINVSEVKKATNEARLASVQSAYKAIKNGNFVYDSSYEYSQPEYNSQSSTPNTPQSRARAPHKAYNSSNMSRDASSGTILHSKNTNPATTAGTILHFFNFFLAVAVLFFAIYIPFKVGFETNRELIIYEVLIGIFCFVSCEIAWHGRPAKEIKILAKIFDIPLMLFIHLDDFAQRHSFQILGILGASIIVFWLFSKNLALSVFIPELVVVGVISLYTAIMEAGQFSNVDATDHPTFRRPLP